MKYFIFFAAVFLVNTINAQSSIDNIKIYKDTLLNPNNFSINMPNSKFLFKNNLGNVYRLPMDNMKCLSPNIQSNMPVYKGNIELNTSNNPQIKPVPIPNPFSKNPPVIFTKPFKH